MWYVITCQWNNVNLSYGLLVKAAVEERGIRMRPDTSNQKNIGKKNSVKQLWGIVLSRIIKVKVVQPRMITFMRPWLFWIW